MGRGFSWLRKQVIPSAQGSGIPEGDGDLSVDLLDEKQGQGEVALGGVLHHGTYEEDDPVTREALVFPREFPVQRRAGDQSLDLTRMQVHVLVVDEVGRRSACPMR